jgi:hypothetical protein
MMLAIGLSYIAFIIMRYIHSIPNFLEAFIMKWCWILLKSLCASIEMIKEFLSLLLLMCSITFNDLHMLKHPCIPEMKWTWTYWMICLIHCWIWFGHYFIDNFCINVH